MKPIDRKKFFDGYRYEFTVLSQSQVDGLEFLLGALENDDFVMSIPWAAYMLATVRHETGQTFQPVKEFGRGVGKEYGKPASNGKVYYGRGYVQITWKENYRLLGNFVNEDLVKNPERALDPVVAYCIMSTGMRHGLFTGRKLSHYLNGDERDYQNARRIINGVDCADKIARYAVKFERILEAAIN